METTVFEQLKEKFLLFHKGMFTFIIAETIHVCKYEIILKHTIIISIQMDTGRHSKSDNNMTEDPMVPRK